MSYLYVFLGIEHYIALPGIMFDICLKFGIGQ